MVISALFPTRHTCLTERLWLLKNLHSKMSLLQIFEIITRLPTISHTRPHTLLNHFMRKQQSLFFFNKQRATGRHIVPLCYIDDVIPELQCIPWMEGKTGAILILLVIHKCNTGWESSLKNLLTRSAISNSRNGWQCLKFTNVTIKCRP